MLAMCPSQPVEQSQLAHNVWTKSLLGIASSLAIFCEQVNQSTNINWCKDKVDITLFDVSVVDSPALVEDVQTACLVNPSQFVFSDTA